MCISLESSTAVYQFLKGKVVTRLYVTILIEVEEH